VPGPWVTAGVGRLVEFCWPGTVGFWMGDFAGWRGLVNVQPSLDMSAPFLGFSMAGAASGGLKTRTGTAEPQPSSLRQLHLAMASSTASVRTRLLRPA